MVFEQKPEGGKGASHKAFLERAILGWIKTVRNSQCKGPKWVSAWCVPEQQGG